MKHILVVLTLAVFAASTATAVWAEGGEPNPPKSDVKSGKALPITKEACEKAGMTWNATTKKCSK
jgi:hypothetical protein